MLILGYLAASELQGRSDLLLADMRKQNEALEDALFRATTAELSQSHFLDNVPDDLISQCDALSESALKLAGGHSTGSDGRILLDAIVRLNAGVVSGFDRAVSAVERGVISSAHYQTG